MMKWGRRIQRLAGPEQFAAESRVSMPAPLPVVPCSTSTAGPGVAQGDVVQLQFGQRLAGMEAEIMDVSSARRVARPMSRPAPVELLLAQLGGRTRRRRGGSVGVATGLQLAAAVEHQPGGHQQRRHHDHDEQRHAAPLAPQPTGCSSRGPAAGAVDRPRSPTPSASATRDDAELGHVAEVDDARRR